MIRYEEDIYALVLTIETFANHDTTPQTRSRHTAKPNEGGSEVGFVIGHSVWVDVRFCSAGPRCLSTSDTFSPQSTPSTSIMENDQPTDDPQMPGVSLSRILDDETIEHLEHHKPLDAPAEGWDEEATGKQLEDGYCVECEGRSASPNGADALTLTSPITQTSRRRCIVNHAQTTSVMYASRRNIERDLGSSTRPNH